MGPSRFGDIVSPPGPWIAVGLLSQECIQQDLPKLFLGCSEYVAETM